MSGRETASSRRALPGSACVFPIADTLLPALFFNPLGWGGGTQPPWLLLILLYLENPLSAWTSKWKNMDLAPVWSGAEDTC